MAISGSFTASRGRVRSKVLRVRFKERGEVYISCERCRFSQLTQPRHSGFSARAARPMS